MKFGRCPAGNADEGFTLLELLIAITLLGFLSVLLFSGLHFGRRSWETTNRSADVTNKVRLFQRELRSELERAYPLMKNDPLHPQIAFKGQANKISFLAPGVDGVPAGEMAQVNILIAQSDGGTLITIGATPELAPERPPTTRHVLLPGLTSLTFSYYGAAKTDGVREWQPTWNNPSRMPELVHLTVVGGSARNEWPDFVVAPRITADMACTYDLLTKFCQGR